MQAAERAGAGRTPVILDTDPGIDDAVAIMLAAASPEIELLGVTTVAGNVGIVNTTRNALALRELLGLNCPVGRGAWRTTADTLAATATAVHGVAGLGEWQLPEPETVQESLPSAVPLLGKLLRESAARGQKATVVAIGPLTNIAQLLVQDAAAGELIAELIVMGGGYGENLGNVTPTAEFNIYTDPEAAAIVFGSGIRLRMVGLNVTETATVGLQHLLAVRGAGGRVFEGLQKMLPVYRDTAGEAGTAPQHDALALASLIRPQLLEFRAARVDVEVRGEHTRGMTVIDFGAQQPNCEVAVSAAVADFRELLNTRLGELAAGMLRQ